MDNSIKDIIRKRKSVLAHFDLTLQETGVHGCFITRNPDFDIEDTMEYITSYEVE